MQDKSLTIASILAAAISSLCCIGPLAAVGLGLGTFGAAALFEPLRSYLLGVTGLFLAGAFYLTYGKQSHRVECDVDGSCAVSTNTKRNRKMLLWLSTAVVVLLAAFPYYSGMGWGNVGARDSMARVSGGGETVAVFSVDGMTCAGCAVGIKATLEHEAGAELAEVDYEKETARVRFKPSKTSVEKLASAISQLGFSAKLKGPPES